jgi:uncharacterized FlaG/YvyC family protein
MIVQNVNLIADSLSLSRGSIPGQPASSDKMHTAELSKVELKAASNLGSGTLQSVVDEANKMFSTVRPDIKFLIDEGTNDVVIMLVDPETGAVINRYPTEQASAISNAIIESQARAADQHLVFRNANDGLLGLFVKQKV